MNELIRIVTNKIKNLCTLRNPPFELPADSYIDEMSGEIINIIFSMWGWISIKDSLPEKNVQVLCYGEEAKNIHDDGLPYKTGIYDGKNWISDHFCESSYINVTHWMPLPQVPK